jgi:hypothetical protein
MSPPSPCLVSSVAIRNGGSAFISIHAATIDQARDYMARTDLARQHAQKSARTDRPPPKHSAAAAIAHGSAAPPNGSANRALANGSAAAAAKGASADNAAGIGGDAKEGRGDATRQRARERAESNEECLSFASTMAVREAPSSASTVGSLIDGWAVWVPLTQLLSVDQLVRRASGKLDTVRTWRLPPLSPLSTTPIGLIAVRCWPFYDRPRELSGPITVGLKWAALYGRQLGWDS